MWIFTRYGFYSVVCAKLPFEGLEVTYSDRVSIRSRRKQHLLALQQRFPELSSAEIWQSDERDYRYRIVVVKELWTSIAAELAREETWTNFKDEVGRFQGKQGKDYVSVLHEVLSVMKKFQHAEAPQREPNETGHLDEETAAQWDGVTLAETVQGEPDRQELADFARDQKWPEALRILSKRPELINATRPGGKSLYAPLHQAAYGGAPLEVVDRLIAIGAWRTLRNAKGERPADIARSKGHTHLLSMLEPVYRRTVPDGILERIQCRLHNLIREVAGDLVACRSLRLPELEPLLEYDRKHFWFAIPGMCGGFHYWLVSSGSQARLIAQSWSRVCAGSGLHHDITAERTILIDKEFV